MNLSPSVIIDFNAKSELTNWRIVDDVVMGGLSDGTFSLSDEGHGVFEGKVSTENNGGFSSVRYQTGGTEVSDFKTIQIRLKGDGKNYQFRLKHKSSDYYAYKTTFETTGEWQNITIKLNDMYPSFRGRTLDQPNFNHAEFEELAFLIGNKKNERFRLLIDKIELK